jgi:hypothetical protein
VIDVAEKVFKFAFCAVIFLMALNVQAKNERGAKKKSKPEIKIKYDYTYNDVVKFLYSFNSHELVLIAHCESFDYRTNRYGIRSIGDKGKAYGMFQFYYKTFLEFAKKSGIHSPHWKNPYQQIYVADWMIRHGYQTRWACYGILKRYHRL